MLTRLIPVGLIVGLMVFVPAPAGVACSVTQAPPLADVIDQESLETAVAFIAVEDIASRPDLGPWGGATFKRVTQVWGDIPDDLNPIPSICGGSYNYASSSKTEPVTGLIGASNQATSISSLIGSVQRSDSPPVQPPLRTPW